MNRMVPAGVGREGGHWSVDVYCGVKTVVHRRGTLNAQAAG
jgi:hypothetical protein